MPSFKDDLVALFDSDEHVPCTALAFRDSGHAGISKEAAAAWRALSDLVNAALTRDAQTVTPLVAALEAARDSPDIDLRNFCQPRVDEAAWSLIFRALRTI